MGWHSRISHFLCHILYKKPVWLGLYVKAFTLRRSSCKNQNYSLWGALLVEQMECGLWQPTALVDGETPFPKETWGYSVHFPPWKRKELLLLLFIPDIPGTLPGIKQTFPDNMFIIHNYQVKWAKVPCISWIIDFHVAPVCCRFGDCLWENALILRAWDDCRLVERVSSSRKQAASVWISGWL